MPRIWLQYGKKGVMVTLEEEEVLGTTLRKKDRKILKCPARKRK